MSLYRFLPRSLRTRFTLIAMASALVVYLLTAPLTIWQGRQLLFEREVYSIQDRLDAMVSKGDSELRAIRQQAIAMTDVVEQWDPKNLETWYDMMETALHRLPKAHGIRLAFEKTSKLGPEGVRSLYIRRGKHEGLERFVVDYDLDDPNAPGAKWYGRIQQNPQAYLDGVWSDPYTAPEVDPEHVVTCSAPVYLADHQNNTFDGVAAIDVTVQTMFKSLQNIKMASSFQVYLLAPSRDITLATCNGNEAEQEKLTQKVAENPQVFRPFHVLQSPSNPDGWFVAINPLTGEKSCFLYQNLRHNPAQLLYVIPIWALESDASLLTLGVCVLGVIGITGMGLLIRWSAGLVTRNLDLLRSGVQNVRSGNLRERIPPAIGHDETADVIDAFNGMVDELQSAFQQTEKLARHNQRIATEFDLARSIQQSALPKPVHLPGGRIFSSTLPAQEIGGDFYDSFLLPGGRVTIAVGDVSGKGVSAAMFMIRASLLLRSAASGMELPDAIAQVNAMLVKSNPEMMFVTLFVAVWDPIEQTITYVNAGHNPPLLLRADDSVLHLDRRSGPALGAMSGMSFPSTKIDFLPGDLLAVYTDGISEAPDASNAQFGVERLQKMLPTHRTTALHLLAEDVIASVAHWQGDAERFDDITLLLARASQSAQMVELAGSLETIEQVVEMVESCATKGGMLAAGAKELGLAACEVVTNIISYALGSDASRTYRFFIAWAGNDLLLRFEDNGPPFDPESLPSIDLRARLEDRPIGGLGWLLIRKATDDVRMDRVAETNILTLIRSKERLTIGERNKAAASKTA